MQLSRSERLDELLRRDGARCLWCGREFSRLIGATTDHLVPKVKGGPSWLENEAAACRRCNSERGHAAPSAWAEECERRGWPVDRPRLVRALTELQAAIARRGGQRRARGYLSAQLRRLTP
ncbi:MAG TPA: HNH endonuclease [Mycobacteriales bacterium]|nr:HNH endonuclease [Mycobacteriales bacterium]